MSDYMNRLKKLEEKEKLLLAEKDKIIEKRKLAIARFAEKFGLLTVSDEVIQGAFSEIKEAVDEKSEKLKNWKTKGESFVKKKKSRAEDLETA